MHLTLLLEHRMHQMQCAAHLRTVLTSVMALHHVCVSAAVKWDRACIGRGKSTRRKSEAAASLEDAPGASEQLLTLQLPLLLRCVEYVASVVAGRPLLCGAPFAICKSCESLCAWLTQAVLRP